MMRGLADYRKYKDFVRGEGEGTEGSEAGQ